jgi:hypothetical protein
MARKTSKPAEVSAEAQAIRESMAEKIAKLFAKAESTNSAAEAATFAEKARALMEAHQLSFADLAQLDKDDALGFENEGLTYWKSENWVGTMAYNLARFYGLEGVRSTHGNQHRLTIIGRESARVTFKAMAPFIKKEIHRLAREEAKRTKTASVWATEIGKAFASRVHQLKAEADAAEATRLAEKPESFALVPVDAIAALMAELFPETKQAPKRKSKVSARAVELAEGISFSGQIMTEASENPFLLAAE